MKTRFQQEISGELGEFWQKHSAEEARNLLERFESDGIIEPDGAIKWSINGKYLMDDACEKLEWAGLNFDRELTAQKRAAQMDEFFNAYRKQDHTPSAEEMSEMRSAFGPGETVVDVLTGKKYHL